MKLVASLIAGALLIPRLATACPAGAPKGYKEIAGQAPRSYQSADDAVSLVVKCDPAITSDDTHKGLAALGEVHVVDKNVSFVEIKKGVMRIYSSVNPAGSQIAVVARSADALKRAAPVIVDYLEH